MTQGDPGERALAQVLQDRRSIRAFTPEPVPREAIERVLRAGIAAPSAGNAQPWRFLAVASLAVRKALAAAALGQAFVAEAPWVVAVCADLARAGSAYGPRGRTLYCLQDTAAAVENMLLCIHALGLASCWVGAFDEAEAGRALGLPDELRPVALLPVGRPAEAPAPTPRRPLDSVVRWIL